MSVLFCVLWLWFASRHPVISMERYNPSPGPLIFGFKSITNERPICLVGCLPLHPEMSGSGGTSANAGRSPIAEGDP